MVSEEIQTIREQTKLGKVQLATKKFEAKQKEKKSKEWTKLKKLVGKKAVSKRILKKGQISVHIPEVKAPSILGDANRFFKDTLEQERRNMFLWYSVETF